ncbi:MAG: DUF4041 domain-containing protein [Bacteroidetes bacterium]|nr:MAG: DUF4041 domain-containing protein [Bacteroidota bacterium]
MGFFDFLKKKELAEIEMLKSKLVRYQAISDIEDEVQRQRNELTQYISEKEAEIQSLKTKLTTLNTDYQGALETYTRLRKEISLFENKLDLIEFGVYEPVYEFDKSDDYREEQSRIRELQKDMIKDELAAICKTNWTIDGSEAKGRASTKKYIKLTLRAFNGECDSMISKVKWNNVNQMKERIKKAYATINKIGESQTVSIQPKYLDLKIKELILEHEFQLKKQKEKEELRAAQEAMREEEKARREIEQAQKEAEKEEVNYQKALDKARKEVEQATGSKHDKLVAQIEKLEQELREAHERKERALSMAQQTKRGHVYIISNIGSFGEHVYKIGMTRRLEPEDRVKELGDASVPFQFDIHAMIFSEDAPGLENELHKAFSEKKVNMLNNRKEFFNVSISDIENKVDELGLEADFIRIPEAMEYRETLAILNRLNSEEPSHTIEEIIAEEFPTSLTSSDSN